MHPSTAPAPTREVDVRGPRSSARHLTGVPVTAAVATGPAPVAALLDAAAGSCPGCGST